MIKLYFFLLYGLLAFLTPISLVSSDKTTIEDVNGRALKQLIDTKELVAVFWYTKNCPECTTALEELEKIDETTDSFSIEFVKCNDKRASKEFGITTFPQLSYFRSKEMVVFEGSLNEEEQVLEFLTSLDSMNNPDRIEEVRREMLEKVVKDNAFVAVLFCPSASSCKDKKHSADCRKCEKALRELENIDDEAEDLGIGFVKINDDELADEFNLDTLPSLVYYRLQIPIVFDGDLQKEEDVLEWLIKNKSSGDEEDEEIESVSAKGLQTIIESFEHLAVLFYDDGSQSQNVLKELEKIDDDCSRQNIGFVKTDDRRAIKEYGIDELPSIVFFKNKIPNLYDGDLRNEQNLLQWLLQQKDNDEIEDITIEMLGRIIKESKHLVVLFYNNDEEDDMLALAELEKIDDELDTKDISFVRIDDKDASKEYGIDETPTLVYFKHGIPYVFDGDLTKEEKVLEWVTEKTENDHIEEVTHAMLEMLIKNNQQMAAIFSAHDDLAVLFYEKDQRRSEKILADLEGIDDECDTHGIIFVKIDDSEKVRELGIPVPSLVYFENKIPHLYEGELDDEDKVLAWLLFQLGHDEIEEITNEMLDSLIEDNPFVAALFYEKKDKEDLSILNELENIDDECDAHNIIFVKIDDAEEAKEYGIENLPKLLYFENKVPSVYEGDLNDEQSVLKWLLEQRTSDTIEIVTDEMVEKLVTNHQYVAVYFSGPCEEDQKCHEILQILENSDDETDVSGIQFVTTEETKFAKKLGYKNFPLLVMFRNGDPLLYDGSLEDEDEVITWLTEEDTLTLPDRIEEVNLRMLQKLLDTNTDVVVYFYHQNDRKHEKILNELENIDDETEDLDVSFVKISDEAMLREYELDPLPVLVYFREKFPQIYPGDLTKEELVLKWIKELKDKPKDTIEEVDKRTLRMLLDELDHVAVLFAEDFDCNTCDEILKELETIDDDAQDIGIHFVKTLDTKIAEDLRVKEYPALVYFQGGVPSVYKGNLTAESAGRWLLKLFALLNEDDDEFDDEDETGPNYLHHQSSKQKPKCMQIKVKEELRPELIFKCCPEDYDHCGKLLEEEISRNRKLAEKNQNKKKKNKSKKGVNNDSGEDIQYDSDEDQDDDEDDDDDNQKSQDKLKQLKLREKLELELNKSRELEDQRKQIVRQKILQTGKLSAGDLLQEIDVLNFLVYHRKFEALPDLTRSDLDDLIVDSDYLAVLFYANLTDVNARSLRRTSIIAEDAAEFGVPIAKMGDPLIAKKYGVRDPPGLVLFRRGRSIKYEDDMEDEDEILDWLTAPENMVLKDQIEVVNKKMLNRMLESTGHLAVLFFSETDCKQCERVLAALEEIDDEAEQAAISFIRVNDWELAKSYGVHALPALIWLTSSEPVIYAGSWKSERILEWLLMRKDPSGVAMTEVDEKELEEMSTGEESIVVYFYNKTECVCEVDKHRKKKDIDPQFEAQRLLKCQTCQQILEILENVDDEVKRYGVRFVRTGASPKNILGVVDLPIIAYIDSGQASVFDSSSYGSFSEILEEDIIHFIIEHKTEDRIELVTRAMLETMLKEVNYLAVFFYKQPCRACDTILMELEKIDDDCDTYGIQMVKIADLTLAKRYGINSFPGLLFFRNGNPLLFEGDLKNEDSVLEWLTDDENRELADEIEAVNGKMLERLVESSPFLAVFFFDEDECGSECDDILAVLEEIDELCDEYGIDMVKVTDGDIAADYNIMNLPTLTYFRRGTALIYEGDMMDSAQIFGWLTSNEVFEIKDEIEEVNRRMLDKLLDDSDFVATYFYEEDDPKSDEILTELERIDTEIDNLDIVFVKICDTKYSRKWGVSKTPALVWFKRKFPSIYRGDLMDGQQVLEWLQKNRYKQPELSLFMLSLASLSLAFVIYSIFIVVCLKHPEEN